MKHQIEICTRMIEYKPPRIAMLLVASAVIVQVALPARWSAHPPLPIPGVVTIAVGIIMMLRAWSLFRTHGTAICPTSDSSAFISDDIYTLTRNPMYLGMVLILAGIALFAGSWPFYAVAVIYALILNNVFCRYEERKLRAQFGEQYAKYAANVRRWL